MTSSASSGNQAAIHSGRSKKANAGRPARRMAPRRTRPLALMKFTSSRIRPGAATPAVTGESLATRARLSATACRQKACRVRSRGGSAASTADIVSPEKTVSSTTATESASAIAASWEVSGADPAST